MRFPRHNPDSAVVARMLAVDPGASVGQIVDLAIALP